MALVVAFLNTKGGVGKSTLAAHFAIELFDRGIATSLVDADPQGTAINHVQSAEPNLRCQTATKLEQIDAASRPFCNTAAATLSIRQLGEDDAGFERHRTFQARQVEVKTFKDLSEQEILALAISLEEEDARIYDDFAQGLEAEYPVTAEALRQMRAEEDGHRHRLIEVYRRRFGDHIRLIRRQDIKGLVERRPVWLLRPPGLDAVRKRIAEMELETKRFYAKAPEQATDANVRQLLGDLAEAERKHQALAAELESQRRASGADEDERATQKRLFVLQVIQPGLAGLMDGSVSTHAPLFAAAFARPEIVTSA